MVTIVTNLLLVFKIKNKYFNILDFETVQCALIAKHHIL